MTYSLSGATPLITLTEHTSWICDLAFSPDGKFLASAASLRDGIILWQVENWQSKRIPGDSQVVFSPDGSLWATAGKFGVVKLYRVSDTELVASFDSGTGTTCAGVAFSPDSQLLAALFNNGNYVTVWQVSSGNLIHRLPMKHSNHLAFSTDGSLLAVASELNRVVLWDMATGKRLKTLSIFSEPVHSVAFSPDGRYLACGTFDCEIQLRPTSVWKADWKKDILRGHSSVVSSIAFSPDSTLLASASWDKTVMLWEVESRNLRQILKGHEGMVSSVAFSPDGKLIASVAEDKTVHIWELKYDFDW